MQIIIALVRVIDYNEKSCTHHECGTNYRLHALLSNRWSIVIQWTCAEICCIMYTSTCNRFLRPIATQ